MDRPFSTSPKGTLITSQKGSANLISAKFSVPKRDVGKARSTDGKPLCSQGDCLNFSCPLKDMALVFPKGKCSIVLHTLGGRRETVRVGACGSPRPAPVFTPPVLAGRLIRKTWYRTGRSADRLAGRWLYRPSSPSGPPSPGPTTRKIERSKKSAGRNQAGDFPPLTPTAFTIQAHHDFPGYPLSEKAPPSRGQDTSTLLRGPSPRGWGGGDSVPRPMVTFRGSEQARILKKVNGGLNRLETAPK